MKPRHFLLKFLAPGLVGLAVFVLSGRGMHAREAGAPASAPAPLLHEGERLNVPDTSPLRRAEEMAAAFERLQTRILPTLGLSGAAIIGQKQVGPGLEMILAARRAFICAPPISSGRFELL